MANHMLDLAAMLGSGELVLTDTNLSVSGRARSPEDYENILAALEAEQPAGLAITYQDVSPSVADAYVLEVVRSANGVELIGFMPSEEAKSEVLDEAYSLFGQEATEDQLQIADGAPRMDWIGAAKFALGQVAQLSGGSARISDFSYSITGAAASSEAYEALRTQLAGTLPGESGAQQRPPQRAGGFALSLQRRRRARDGDARRRRSVAGIARRGRRCGDAALRQPDRQQRDAPRQRSPVGFDAAVIAGLQAISRLEAGRFELVDLTVQVSGVAPYEGAIARIEDQLRAALPDGFTLTTNLTAAPPQARVTPAACQELLTTELGEGGIQFGEGSAAIAPESEGRIDRLVAILPRCPDAAVEIGGYTDAGGTTARNQALSQIRAQAVVDYLEQAGIAADRLTAVGYGEANPIASNDTEEGRAANRRIEFKVDPALIILCFLYCRSTGPISSALC